MISFCGEEGYQRGYNETEQTEETFGNESLFECFGFATYEYPTHQSEYDMLERPCF